MANPIAPIAQAITAGFKLLHSIQKDRHVRRLRLAVSSGGDYIRENEGKVVNKKKLAKHKNKFFKYDQG